MDKRKRKEKMYNMKKKCAYSGKCVGNKDIVLVEHVKDMCRKMGCIVFDFRLLILIIGLFLFMPIVSAQAPQGFEFSLTNRMNIVMMFTFLVFSGILVFYRLYVFSSIILITLGFMLLFNDFNVVLSFIVISIGVVVVTVNK